MAWGDRQIQTLSEQLVGVCLALKGIRRRTQVLIPLARIERQRTPVSDPDSGPEQEGATGLGMLFGMPEQSASHASPCEGFLDVEALQLAGARAVNQVVACAQGYLRKADHMACAFRDQYGSVWPAYQARQASASTPQGVAGHGIGGVGGLPGLLGHMAYAQPQPKRGWFRETFSLTFGQ
jgi:hypothetical protein